MEKEKRTDVPFNFYTLTFSGEKKRPLTAGIQFFNTIFKNSDIYILYIKLKAARGYCGPRQFGPIVFTYQCKYAL